MKRLTTDTPKDNLETALNLFYIKDHETWVRGYGPAPEYADVSLFDLTRDIVKTHIPDVELPEDDDDLSNMMPEWLMDGIDSAEGKSCGNYHYQNAEKLDFEDALWAAISALRQQETVTNRNGLNEPLTLDELRHMDGEPVWTVTAGVSGSGRWELCTCETVCACPLHKVLRCVTADGEVTDYDLDTYGKTWLAYRQKPEEGTV